MAEYQCNLDWYSIMSIECQYSVDKVAVHREVTNTTRRCINVMPLLYRLITILSRYCIYTILKRWIILCLDDLSKNFNCFGYFHIIFSRSIKWYRYQYQLFFKHSIDTYSSLNRHLIDIELYSIDTI